MTIAPLYAHSFDNTFPPARYDGVAWTRVLVEESATGATWTQIADLPVAADTTPETPNAVDITVTSATLERGYFRFRFRDAAGVLSPYTTSVFSPGGGAAAAYPWRPTVQQVAKLVPAYTRGGFDDDALAPSSGAETLTFTDRTSPTASHVDELIDAACKEVQGRAGPIIPPRLYGLAETAAKWHVAAVISGGKQPADTDDASGEYRAHITSFRASLDELTYQVRLALTPRLR